jgi:hypothetical protein
VEEVEEVEEVEKVQVFKFSSRQKVQHGSSMPIGLL